jgi:hypothetical protein
MLNIDKEIIKHFFYLCEWFKTEKFLNRHKMLDNDYNLIYNNRKYINN